MSLRDDFLEALRSVKRDFFKDYEVGDQDNQHPARQNGVSASPAPEQEEPWFTLPPVEVEAFDEDSTYGEADVEHFPPAQKQEWEAAEETVAQVHTGDTGDYDDEDEESVAPDVDMTPYRLSNDRAETDQDEDTRNSGSFDPDRYITDLRTIIDDYDSDGTSLNDEKTIISKNTVIRGALQTDDSVRMFGQILGDIDCKSNILVAGKVRGNTSAANAYVIDAQVDGNLLCDDVVNVTDDAWILGNIRAQQAEIDGKIKGNIEIRHTISIGSNSSVIGNISTDELEIKRGAFVNGQIMMYSPSRDVIDRFDSFDR